MPSISFSGGTLTAHMPLALVCGKAVQEPVLEIGA